LTDDPVDLIAERVNVAFQAGRPVNASLVARKLWVARKILLASPGYLKRRGEPRGLTTCVIMILWSKAGRSKAW
jgi:hypothetical protein